VGRGRDGGLEVHSPKKKRKRTDALGGKGQDPRNRVLPFMGRSKRGGVGQEVVKDLRKGGGTAGTKDKGSGKLLEDEGRRQSCANVNTAGL